MMDIRRPTPDETAAVRRLWELSFPEGGPDYVDWVFADLYRPGQALALFAGGRMAASLMMVPYNMALRGGAVGVETLSGVDTDPACRNRGYAKALMAAALRDMADRGVGFTFLYPFDHCFYTRLGWATVCHALEYTCPAVELPTLPAGWQVVESPSVDAMSALSDRAMAPYHCRILRGPDDWARRLGENRSLHGFPVAVARDGELRAYALCEPAEEETNLGELVALDPAAARALLAALAPHGRAVTWKAPADDRLSLLPGRWYGRVRRQPHTMMRITDLPRAVAALAAAGDGQVTLELTDALAPWNAGRWRLSARGGAGQAVSAGEVPQFQCDIGVLCRVLTGALTAADALAWGLAQGERQAADTLDRLYPPCNNFTHELY